MLKKLELPLFPALSLLFLFCLFPLAPAAMAQPPDEARKAGLTRLVRQDCGSCHGMTLKGGLGKPLLPHDLKEQTVSELADIILDGVPGTPMPGWRGLLSRDEAYWIARQLKSGAIKRGNVK